MTVIGLADQKPVNDRALRGVLAQRRRSGSEKEIFSFGDFIGAILNKDLARVRTRGESPRINPE